MQSHLFFDQMCHDNANVASAEAATEWRLS